MGHTWGMNRSERGQASLSTRVTHAVVTHRWRHSQRPQGIGRGQAGARRNLTALPFCLPSPGKRGR